MVTRKITDEQLQQELNEGLGPTEIAKKYNMSRRNVQLRSARLAKKGVGHGRDVSHLVPDGYKIKGTSSLVDEFGNTKLQWVKTDTDAERQVELMRAVIDGMKSDITPVSVVPPPKKRLNEKLLNLYTVSDFHLGMLAWADESGDDWDMKIAEDLFSKWFDAAFQKAPDAGVGVINLLGDFAHFDSLDAVTPSSGHVLDADTRYQKLVRYMIRMVRRVVNMALVKHKSVRLLIVQGNHDESGMIWLAEMFNTLYDNEPRVFVDTSPDVYKMVQHGKTTLFFHHGHKARFDAIEPVMIAKFRKAFGESVYSYAHVGHLHHQKIVESRNMIVEQHRTLAAKDAYASRGGWMSGRSANVITYSAEYGEVARLTISPEMLG
ncbi:TPA_asm: winged helix-turn-helix domain-containing protein [Salmonella enterica subsp. enterica serovar Typhimurium str. SL1344]|uniref:Winged helix-turn-helix domain-containing protein n=1 Tax=Salmonella typhimurium (strain SL1344) TaxID=216597 RepID=A0A718MPE5_SALTS|nr:winged helix-turn-helix domain-containing protein [Salmonella enterica subsp. enterica serovar Typhimurium str. SL1344]HAD6533655.1 winged helix-turn-helix domain-containing protein [Salmonella enterica subsp. enterica serovar Typhimurium str. SL1344]HAD6538541.1 winged helix-turn-helix domain-containing protein [Salmonella enterica subsp. enterica serovar Typhimurium str. SL1344]HAD6557295.1 winged helix-turn-helix domain-containing protein [Salmonella enterica subsp. enterica serovar Typhim